MPPKEWFIIFKKIQKKTCLKVKASGRVKTSLNDGGGGVSVKMTHTLSLYQMDLNTVLKSKSKGNKTPQR